MIALVFFIRYHYNMESEQKNILQELPIEWREYEYRHRPKNGNWFWFVASGALVLIIISILLKNFLLGVVAIAGAFAVAMLGAQTPRKLNYAIEKRGVKAGAHFYPFKELESFWISYEPPHKKELILKSKKKIIKHVHISLGHNNPKKIRDILKKILKEEEYEETFTDILTERLGI